MSTLAPARPRHLLQIADLTGVELATLLDLAEAMRSSPRGWLHSHEGEMLVTLFEKPSTRTRVSFAAAAQRLGMLPLVLSGNDLQIGRGETIADTARVLSGYASAVAVRMFGQERISALATAARVPVINALSDQHHPCQALADLLTLRDRFGTLTGLRVAYVGDGNNVAHSLMQAGALAGMDVAVACPADYEPDPAVVAEASAVAAQTGGAIDVLRDPAAAAAGADAIYTDVWVSMGDERQAQARRRALAPYAVTDALFAEAADRAVFLHCLPAHRGEEVAAAVIDGPRSVVFAQAANRMHTEQALIHWLLARGAC
jgi:ornithine carbamoyltransferase